MSDVANALFQQMRLTILLTAKDGIEESPFHPAYLHAWDDGVYPLLDDGAGWHKPHADEFPISKELVDTLHSILCHHWDNKTRITFWELEDELGIHGGVVSDGDFTRGQVVSICRYFYLKGNFDNDFWAKLCSKGGSPGEASAIAGDRDVHVYFT
ncbi:hypothetical protein CUU95_18280 [Vreelandella alkaliphila]|uniref:hypothetical protein n=1 Tax=Vreelandella alkaliphila TaxID=272774 RepID=UPI000EA21B0E|nr:hypothetical protein [Halomonas alkaliphila]AYF35643.1 hypothetical protein CUU95_18280 [Halomonas alkaliphila]